MAIQAKHLEITFHVGDTVRVHYKIIEKEVVAGKTKKEKHEEQKERTQVFEGIVLAIKGKGDSQSFIVRRIGAGNIGIERIFPLISPWIKKIDVKKQGNIRRAKLYYLRKKTGKEAIKVKELLTSSPKVASVKKSGKTKGAVPETSTNVVQPANG